MARLGPGPAPLGHQSRPLGAGRCVELAKRLGGRAACVREERDTAAGGCRRKPRQAFSDRCQPLLHGLGLCCSHAQLHKGLAGRAGLVERNRGDTIGTARTQWQPICLETPRHTPCSTTESTPLPTVNFFVRIPANHFLGRLRSAEKLWESHYAVRLLSVRSAVQSSQDVPLTR